VERARKNQLALKTEPRFLQRDQMMAAVATSLLPPRAHRPMVNQHSAMPDGPKGEQTVCHALMKFSSRAMRRASPVSDLSISLGWDSNMYGGMRLGKSSGRDRPQMSCQGTSYGME
jgi:hypothetical protein